MRKKAEDHEQGSVKPTLKIPVSCRIDPSSRLLGQVKVGNHIYIGPNVLIYSPCEIGEGSYIGANCVIGFPTRAELRSGREARSPEDLMKRRRGWVRIGRGMTIRTNCIIYPEVKLGDEVELGHNVLLREQTEIGRCTLIGSNVTVDGKCKIGSKVSVQTGAYISINTNIEDKAFLGPNCSLLNDLYMKQKAYALRGPTVKAGASIGGGAVIMPNITVGKGAMVGAGAVVTKDVESGVMVAGVPAKRLKEVPKRWKIR